MGVSVCVSVCLSPVGPRTRAARGWCHVTDEPRGGWCHVTSLRADSTGASVGVGSAALCGAAPPGALSLSPVLLIQSSLQA